MSIAKTLSLPAQEANAPMFSGTASTFAALCLAKEFPQNGERLPGEGTGATDTSVSPPPNVLQAGQSNC